MLLTASDDKLLAALTRVRTVSVAQVADYLFSGSYGYASRRLAVLEAAGYVEMYSLLAAEPILAEPLVVWRPDRDSFPQVSKLAHVLSTRWANLELKARKCIVLSRLYARSIGAQGIRKSRQSEGTHDLGCAAVYLCQSTDRQAAWQSECALAKRKVKKPDATIHLGGLIAVEIGGSSYTEAKLEGLFTWCKEQGMVAIELW